jgi:hypothetical protein
LLIKGILLYLEFNKDEEFKNEDRFSKGDIQRLYSLG